MYIPSSGDGLNLDEIICCSAAAIVPGQVQEGDGHLQSCYVRIGACFYNAMTSPGYWTFDVTVGSQPRPSQSQLYRVHV